MPQLRSVVASLIERDSRLAVRNADLIRASVAALLDKESQAEWRRVRREADL